MLKEYCNYALNLCLGHSYYLNHKMMLNFNIYFASSDRVAGSTPDRGYLGNGLLFFPYLA